MPSARASRRLASVARELKENVSTDWRTQGPYQWGTVGVIHSGSPFGTLDIYLDSNSSSPGATLALGIPFLNGYNPTVGDIVLVARMAGAARTQRVVLGPLEAVGQGLSQNGLESVAALAIAGLTGATGGSGYRLVGATTFGPPLTGTFDVNDVIEDLTTYGMWVCTVAGTSGTWAPIGGAVTSPKAPSITVNTTGSTSWWYAIAAEGKNGSTFYDAIPGTATKITNGAATPNNTINWTAPLGVNGSLVAYVVLRSADGITYNRIDFAAAGVTTFTDNNATGVAYTASTTNPGGNFVIGGNLYKARASFGGALTLTTAVWAQVLLNTVTYDPNGNFDAVTNHVYTIPVSGYYSLVGRSQSASATALIGAGFIRNGTGGTSRQTFVGSGTANGGGASAPDTLYFNAGDTLGLEMMETAATGAQTVACFMQIQYEGS